jgi:multidrug efflux pump subunit AcrB
VQYRVQGPDIAQVRAIALRVAQTLGANTQVKDVNFDWIEPSRKVRISIDQDQARLLGLSSQALAQVLNAVMTGTPITQVRDNIYLVDVIARAQDEQRISLSTLQGLQLPLPNGRGVPLSQIATFDFVQEYPLVWRRQRVPTLTVQADVASGATPEAAVQALAPEIAKLSKNLPKGYRIDVGGTVEESAQSQASVFDKVPLMLLLMLVFLMAQLHSFSRLALVLSVVPMGLIGIVIALLAFGQPLGFVAILGAKARDLGCRRRSNAVALSPDHADGDLHRAGIHPDRTDGVLGADGFRDHGRPVRGDDPDADRSARTLRDLVPGQGAGGRRARTGKRMNELTAATPTLGRASRS